MKTATTLLLLTCTLVVAQRIQNFEMRQAADGQRLYITLDGTDRLISNRAVKAWHGWAPHILIYAERMTAGSPYQRLRWTDTFTRDSFTIANDEPLEYTDVTPVRIAGGDYVLLISLRDSESKAPWVELATPNGVLLREQYAAWGTAADGRAQLRRFRPADIERTGGDISLLAPEVIASVPIGAVPEFTVPGLYEFAGPEQTVTLNLRAGGTGTLVVQQEGKGQPSARQGKWTQRGREVEFEGMTWVAGLNGMTPKQWGRKEWGATGLPLRRTSK